MNGTPHSELHIGGIVLPLGETADGPLVVTRECGALEPLAWVVNAALAGDWKGLAEVLRKGGDARDDDLYVYAPGPLDDDVGAARERWRALAGYDPGEDVLICGPGWNKGRLLVPRLFLIEVITRLEAMRQSKAERDSGTSST